MKFRFLLSLFAIITVAFTACDDSVANLGKDILPVTDKITINTDTFHLTSETLPVEKIISRPDSFLLGTYIDDVYGTTRGDILTQVANFKDGYTFLDSSVATYTADSVVISFNYLTYFGSTTSPVQIYAYELNKGLIFKNDYYTDINPADYADLNKPIGSTIITVKNVQAGTINSSAVFKLSDEFLHRFFTKDASVYASKDNFQNFFKGLYLTTNFGSSTMFNVNNLAITLYFHYAYKTDPETNIKGYLLFPANTEVKRINRIQHPERPIVITPNDEFNYVTSPANYYTKVRIPLDRIRQRIKVQGKRLDVNSAILKVNVLDNAKLPFTTYIPNVGTMLLVKESALQRFFDKHELPSDTCAFLANRGFENITATTYKYNYTFNALNKLITNEITTGTKPYMDMYLVPVTPKYVLDSSGNSVLSEVNPDNQMEAASIYSGKNKEMPLKLEVVYSGF